MPDSHLTDDQLALFTDGDLPEGAAAHLTSCEDCGKRLREVKRVMTAYIEYRGKALPPQPWESFDTLIRARKSSRWWPRFALAAAICTVLAALAWHQAADRPSARTNELLERSAEITVPEGGMISIRSDGRTMTRPAVLANGTRDRDPEFAHLQTLFVAARYSWREPLSARSFRTWRSGLRAKRDSVSVIRRGGMKDAYRIRTESPAGVLRSVSLTLRGVDLRPIDGTFAFDGEAPLEMSDVPTIPAQPFQPGRPVTPVPAPETLATPEDTLHVLAALDAIAADVGDPIEISEDPGHRNVVVRGNGLAPERRKAIEEALKPLPRVVLQFDSGAPGPLAGRLTSTADQNSADIPADFRRQLEDRFGGAVALQEVTDRVLESSASIVARTHALQTLATEFPAGVAASMSQRDREVLHDLRRRHVVELRRLFTRMRADLQPLLRDVGTPAPVAVPDLVLAARDTDSLLNRLLAGSYNQATGQDLLRDVPREMNRLELSLKAEEQADQ